MAPAWKDESGWTLPELLLGMVLSLSIAASSLVVLQTTLHSQSATGSRLAAQDDGTFAMLRMTKDIRTATAATVQDARTLDLLVPQHNPAGGGVVATHVRYACVGVPGSCARYTCGTPFTANSCGSPSSVVIVSQGVTNSDNFRGVSLGVDQPFPSSTPASWAGTGAAAQNNVGFIGLHLQVIRTDGAMSWRSTRPLDFLDGADLENFTN
jgi:Tfp pilus assembly protein PilW